MKEPISHLSLEIYKETQDTDVQWEAGTDWR